SQTGEYQKAIEAYKKALKLQDPDSETYYALGEAYTKLARYKEAMDAYRHALDLDPDFFRASEALERAKAGNDRVESARKEYEKQLKRQREGNSNQNGNQNTNQANNNNSRSNTNH
ncbi:MAG TPA: tetratricopeptide repeat protein, partial [Pyrinomonadaceae bacterium]